MLQDMVLYLNFLLRHRQQTAASVMRQKHVQQASHNVAKNSHCNRILITEGLAIRFDRNSYLQFSVQSI